MQEVAHRFDLEPVAQHLGGGRPLVFSPTRRAASRGSIAPTGDARVKDMIAAPSSGWVPGDSMAGFYHDAVKPSRLLSICAALLVLCAGCTSATVDPAPASATPARNAASADLPAGDDLGTSLVRRCGVRGAARAAEGHPGRRQHLGIGAARVARRRPSSHGRRGTTGTVQFLGIDIQDERGSAGSSSRSTTGPIPACSTRTDPFAIISGSPASPIPSSTGATAPSSQPTAARSTLRP